MIIIRTKWRLYNTSLVHLSGTSSYKHYNIVNSRNKVGQNLWLLSLLTRRVGCSSSLTIFSLIFKHLHQTTIHESLPSMHEGNK